LLLRPEKNTQSSLNTSGCGVLKLQFIDLDDNENLRIDFCDFGAAKKISTLYLQSSIDTSGLSKLFVQRSLAKFDDYEQLVKPLKDYYETKGVEIIEQNFQLHSEFFKQHSEFFKVEFHVEISKPYNQDEITGEEVGTKTISHSDNLIFREKLNKYLGI
jgi:hypothetical protein